MSHTVVNANVHRFSRWACPHGHTVQLEPLTEDELVYCMQPLDAMMTRVCGLRMSRILQVEIYAA